jgi:hypothetical protein
MLDTSVPADGGKGVEPVAISELIDLGHVHIGVTATIYTNVRLHLCATPSISSVAPSAGGPPRPPPSPTTATNHHFLQHPSADVAVNYCRQDTGSPTGILIRWGFLVTYFMSTTQHSSTTMREPRRIVSGETLSPDRELRENA